MSLIVSVVGARPNFMKVAPISRAFKKYEPKHRHVIVHTGQHYDAKMSDAFFKDLEMPIPGAFLGIGSGSHAEQTGKAMMEFEKFCVENSPDFVIVVGDVNSTLACAITAVKLGIKCAHVEAGLRSFDRAMPEEINRMAVDAIADYAFITEESAKVNLLKADYPKENIFFVGNTMIDSLRYALPHSKQSQILDRLSLKAGKYATATIHRPSNVDSPERLEIMLKALAHIASKEKVVFPAHPRTQSKIREFGLESLLNENPNIKIIDPQGYVDFIALAMNSHFIATDSGGIQEEATCLGIPCLTFRTTTERPVTIEIGTNRLINPELDDMRNAIDELYSNVKSEYQIPPLWDGKAGERIAEQIDIILAGK